MILKAMVKLYYFFFLLFLYFKNDFGYNFKLYSPWDSSTLDNFEFCMWSWNHLETWILRLFGK